MFWWFLLQKAKLSNKEKKERIEALNQAKSILTDTESKMAKFKDQMPSEDATKLKEQIKEVKEKLGSMDNMDPEEIKNTVNDIHQQYFKLLEMTFIEVKCALLENGNTK